MKDYSCKNCEKRFVGCHATCETYNQVKKKREEQAKIIRKEKYIDCMVDSYNYATDKSKRVQRGQR